MTKTRNFTKGAILFVALAIFYSFYLVTGRFSEGYNPLRMACWPFYIDNLMPGLVALYGFHRAPEHAGLTDILPHCRKIAFRAWIGLFLLGLVFGSIAPGFAHNLKSVASLSAFFMWLGCSLLLHFVRRSSQKRRRKGRMAHYSIRL